MTQEENLPTIDAQEVPVQPVLELTEEQRKASVELLDEADKEQVLL